MCDVVRYIDNKQNKPILLDYFSSLEYQGYDSSGVAVIENSVKVCRNKVRVGMLQRKSPHPDGISGIAHTRWITHGSPSLANAYLHLDFIDNKQEE